ncbi:MAG: hypothetical protein FWE53_02575 [Firmicutes bacterium]|nr:hypothetical protein [Bacillota bacterium]
MPQKLTSKDLQVMSALLMGEYNGNKKAAHYAHRFGDEDLKTFSHKLANTYKQHFLAIQKMLEAQNK